MVGQTVYAVGYPGLAENIFNESTSSFSSKDATVTSGIISRFSVTTGTGRKMMQIDCVIRPGNSGGPLLNEGGAVIGINTETVSTSDSSTASVYYAVNISEAITILNTQGIEYAYETYAPDNPEPVTIKEDKIDTKLVIIIAVIVAVVVISAVVIVIVLKKKQPTPQPQPIPQPSRRPVVRSLATQNAGAKVTLQGQQIVIGRSRDCALVFAENTPGVSGRHCSLSWNEGQQAFVLTDLQSTYGTYLQNGQRLSPGVAYPLSSGSRFYLGESSNMILVELE